jgi:hypothetical protein
MFHRFSGQHCRSLCVAFESEDPAEEESLVAATMPEGIARRLQDRIFLNFSTCVDNGGLQGYSVAPEVRTFHLPPNPTNRYDACRQRS